jgi:hypothetical protein
VLQADLGGGGGDPACRRAVGPRTEETGMKLHAALARALAGHGVHTMFGLIGDANLFFVHSFTEDGGDYVGAAHEARP